ncbi:1253_t:CDS:10 [Cetraspora pellucida]|uniref:1253_t:CDS:1 n=1 Tax=Cetraspora pellucida TaxID=1433469 RepID=A0ACA9L6B5_9GLOM|nr:1253_t:CDS:10 [Cetraspora pellucida]
MASESQREENSNRQNDDGVPRVDFNLMINDEPIKKPHHRRIPNRSFTQPGYENGKAPLDNVFESLSEETALLSGETSQNYSLFNPQSSIMEDNGSDVHRTRPHINKRHTWSASIKALTAPMRRYKSRSGAYDEDSHAMVREGGGIRVWYDDYTTIDWIHDYVKERVRVRKIHSVKGVRGHFMKLFDSFQGWFLVFLIGVITACVAGAVDVAVEWGSDLKEGYCSTNVFKNKNFCCNNTKGNDCDDWVTWSQAFYTRTEQNFSMFDYFTYVFVALCFAVCAAVLVKYNSLFATPSLKSSSRNRSNHINSNRERKSYAAGSGIPEVKTILSGFVMRGFLGVRTLWVKALTLAMVVAAGMTLGKEGPFVHIACCIGNILSRLFNKYNKNEGKRREILSASAAAGVSVAFAAPIGGVLFSLEEVSYYFPSKTLVRSFFCAIVAAVTLKIIDPFGTGKIVMFQVSYDNDWHVFEIISFLILGVLGGFFGAILCKLIALYTQYVRNKTWLKTHPVIEVIIVVIITATVNFLNDYTRVSNTDLVHYLFSECNDESDSKRAGLCAIAMISKFLTCVITFGIRVPAGIFIPSLLIGACVGRMLGLAVQWLTLTYSDFPIFSSVCDPHKVNDCVNPGVYAMVGAAACLAGVTRMTVSLTVIMFELTGALTYILPIMFAIMIAKWVADGIVKHGIYDLLIILNDHPFLDSKAEYITTAATLDLCQRDAEVIDINDRNTISDLKTRKGHSDAGFPIVDGTRLIGYIASNELEHALKNVEKLSDSTECQFGKSEFEILVPNGRDREHIITDFTAYTDLAPLTVSKNSSLEVVLELFKKLEILNKRPIHDVVILWKNTHYYTGVGIVDCSWRNLVKLVEGKED